MDIQCDFDMIIKEETSQAIRLAAIIKSVFSPQTIIDVGCGPGIYVQELRKLGIDAVGIDIDPRAASEHICICDILSFSSPKKDLALCLEVAEHIKEKYAEDIVKKLCEYSDNILFSAAHPGQGGIGHINCQPKNYWIRLFEKHGYRLNQEKTQRIIDEMNGGYHMGWFVMNAMVFEKRLNVSNKYRFHILGLPHTKTSKEFTACAYTQKVFKLCEMLTERGHTVYHYGVEGSDPVCTENVVVASDQEQKEQYPDDWKKSFFKFDTGDKFHHLFYARTIAKIHERIQDRDFVLCAWGWGHQPIAKEFNDKYLVVESGIGYEETFAKYRVFESNAWMSWVYGKTGESNGHFYDCVIPNFFDPADYIYSDKKEDWFLYLGRLAKRKGLDIAVQVTKELGKKLVIAGQGSLENPNEGLFINEPHVEFVGYADVEKKAHLLSRAKALFVPTYYIEPFGGVAVEAAMSGTPTISTDWGVFPETVLSGITGYRCRTFEQFCWAAKNIDNISPDNCRKWAVENFSCDRVVLSYEEYFHMLQDLYSQGWYEPNPSRTELNWLSKEYPQEQT